VGLAPRTTRLVTTGVATLASLCSTAGMACAATAPDFQLAYFASARTIGGQRSVVVRDMAIQNFGTFHADVRCHCDRLRGPVRTSKAPGDHEYLGVNWVLRPGQRVRAEDYGYGDYGRYAILAAQLRPRARLVTVASGCLEPGSLQPAQCPGGPAVPPTGSSTLVAAGTPLTIGPQLGSVSPSCPASPCLAVTGVVGFQTALAGAANPDTVNTDGHVTAFTLALGAPTPAQVTFFDQREGGQPRAGLTILRKDTSSTYRVVGLTQTFDLTPYLGRTETFSLAAPLPAYAGDIIALNVTSWAPALAIGQPSSTTWQAARTAGRCRTNAVPTPTPFFDDDLVFGCGYEAAELTFDAAMTAGL